MSDPCWVAHQVRDGAREIVVTKFASYDEAQAYYDRNKANWGMPDKISPPFVARDEQEAKERATLYLSRP